MHKGKIEEKGEINRILYNAKAETRAFIQGELLI